MRTTAQRIERARAHGRKCIAKMVDDYSWTIPVYKDRTLNKASNDAAEIVRKKIATAIRTLRK
jgi:hypothetical protein